MRLFLVLVLAGAVAYGLWTLLSDESNPASVLPREEAPAPEPEPAAAPRPIPTTVSLTLIVRTEGSTVPRRAVAGYRWGGDDRLRPVDARGRVMFTDAPGGRITLLARAPGYEEVEQERYLTPGVPTDAILTLKPRRKP